MEQDPSSDPVYKTWVVVVEKERASGYASLSAAERAFYDVYLLDLEVSNGGFLQYFGNTEGVFAGSVVGSLKTIGAAQTAERVEQFWRRVFPDGVPEDASARRDLALLVEDDYGRFEADEGALSDWYCTDAETIFPRLRQHAERHGFLVA